MRKENNCLGLSSLTLGLGTSNPFKLEGSSKNCTLSHEVHVFNHGESCVSMVDLINEIDTGWGAAPTPSLSTFVMLVTSDTRREEGEQIPSK